MDYFILGMICFVAGCFTGAYRGLIALKEYDRIIRAKLAGDAK
jgi:hypothetical protein